MDEKLKNIGREDSIKENLGFILWHLESIENFFPCYKTMIKQE
jgi:hypothetical protein